MFFAYIMQYRNTYICSCSILYLVYYVLYFHWQVSHCQGHSTSIAIQMPGEIIPVYEIQKYHSWTDSLSKYKNIIFALRVIIRLEGWSCRWWWPDMISMWTFLTWRISCRQLWDTSGLRNVLTIPRGPNIHPLQLQAHPVWNKKYKHQKYWQQKSGHQKYKYK